MCPPPFANVCEPRQVFSERKYERCVSSCWATGNDVQPGFTPSLISLWDLSFSLDGSHRMDGQHATERLLISPPRWPYFCMAPSTTKYNQLLLPKRTRGEWGRIVSRTNGTSCVTILVCVQQLTSSQPLQLKSAFWTNTVFSHNCIYIYDVRQSKIIFKRSHVLTINWKWVMLD